jgi:hypothetical protein
VTVTAKRASGKPHDGFRDDFRALVREAAKIFRACPALATHHGIHHALSSAEHALRILEAGRFVPEDRVTRESAVAALLHDLGMTRLTDERHGPTGADLAVRLLETLREEGRLRGWRDNAFLRIRRAIAEHDRKEAPETRRDPVARIVFDADNADALGAFGFYRYLAVYRGRGWTMEELLEGRLDPASGERRLSVAGNLECRWNAMDVESRELFRAMRLESLGLVEALACPESRMHDLVRVFWEMPEQDAGTGQEGFAAALKSELAAWKAAFKRRFPESGGKRSAAGRFLEQCENAARTPDILFPRLNRVCPVPVSRLLSGAA